MKIRLSTSIILLLLFVFSCKEKDNGINYFTSFDGVRIAYTDDGDGAPVMLIHGFILDGITNWGNSALKKQLINEGYRVIIPDLRGNGLSDRPTDEDAYKNDAEVKDLIALMDHLEVENYRAVGYSRGAIVLANLLTEEDRVTMAVFGGMGIHFTDPNWYRRIEFGNVFSGRAEPNELTQGAVDIAKDLEVNFKIMGHLQDYQPETSVEELNEIKIKTLVICGDEDLDNGNPGDLQEQLPNSRLSIVSGTHMSTFSSVGFAESIIDFLNEK